MNLSKNTKIKHVVAFTTDSVCTRKITSSSNELEVLVWINQDI